MNTLREPPAKSNAMLDRKIALIELRLQRDRTITRLRTNALKKGMHDSLTSPLALLLAAGTGFAAHRFDLLHRPKPSIEAASQPSTPDSLLDGMIRTFTFAAWLIALVPDASPSKAGEVTSDTSA
jgi:hypothetical protein